MNTYDIFLASDDTKKGTVRTATADLALVAAVFRFGGCCKDYKAVIAE